MLTPQDVNALRRSQNGMMTAGLWLLGLTSIGCLVVGVLGLRLAMDLAEAGRVGFGELMRGWITDPRLDQLYTGIYVAAISRLRVAVLGLAAGVVGLAVLYGLIVTRRRNRRLVRFIESRAGDTRNG